MIRKALSWIWPAAACLFWLLLLSGAILRIHGDGWNEYAAELLIIPACMIVLTLICGFAMSRMPRASILGVAATVVAVLAALYWLAVWGAGV